MRVWVSVTPLGSSDINIIVLLLDPRPPPRSSSSSSSSSSGSSSSSSSGGGGGSSSSSGGGGGSSSSSSSSFAVSILGLFCVAAAGAVAVVVGRCPAALQLLPDVTDIVTYTTV